MRTLVGALLLGAAFTAGACDQIPDDAEEALGQSVVERESSAAPAAAGGGAAPGTGRTYFSCPKGDERGRLEIADCTREGRVEEDVSCAQALDACLAHGRATGSAPLFCAWNGNPLIKTSGRCVATPETRGSRSPVYVNPAPLPSDRLPAVVGVCPAGDEPGTVTLDRCGEATTTHGLTCAAAVVYCSKIVPLFSERAVTCSWNGKPLIEQSGQCPAPRGR